MEGGRPGVQAKPGDFAQHGRRDALRVSAVVQRVVIETTR